MVSILMLVLKILFLLFLSSTVQANSMAGSSSASLGGTGRADVKGNESVFLNPAALAFLNRFYVGACYQSGFLFKDIHRETYGAVLTDSTPGLMVAGSLAYRRHKIHQAGKYQFLEDEFKLGLAHNLSKRLSLGVAATHLKAKTQGEAAKEIEQTNGDMGLLFGLLPHWNVSLVAENLLETDSKVPVSLMRDSLVSLGTRYIYELFLDVRYEILHPLKEKSGGSFKPSESSFGFGCKIKVLFSFKSWIFIG